MSIATHITNNGRLTVVTLVGACGPQGARGGITFLGELGSAGDLPPTGAPGDAFAISGRIFLRTADERWVDAGPVGAPGKDGQIRFTGSGEPPAVIVGAQPGDTYLDLDTGNIFKLI